MMRAPSLVRPFAHLAALAALGLTSSCATSTLVENADLTSIGNIKRYEQEQAARDQRAENLRTQNAALNNRLQQRLDRRAALLQEEQSLQAQLASQNQRLSTVGQEIDAAQRRRAITDAEHKSLMHRVDQTKADIARYQALQDLTAIELRQGQETSQRSESLIRGVENLARSGFKNVSAFIGTLGFSR